MKVDFVSGFLCAPPWSCEHRCRAQIGEGISRIVQKAVACGYSHLNCYLCKLICQNCMPFNSVCLFNPFHTLTTSLWLNVLQALLMGILLILFLQLQLLLLSCICLFSVRLHLIPLLFIHVSPQSWKGRCKKRRM